MTTPASVTRGEEFSISWMIENLGDEAVSTWGYIDGVFLSPTSTFNSLTAERLTSYEVHAAEAPAPGESRTYTQDVSLGGGPAGTFYFAPSWPTNTGTSANRTKTTTSRSSRWRRSR